MKPFILYSIGFMISIMLPGKAVTQLCPGSFGDPVINIDFGRGATVYGPPLGSSTNYYYSKSQGPSDGYYTIIKKLSEGGGAWHSIKNHTPNDRDGYFMMINADYDPGVFYETEVLTELCPNTTYEFAAWVANLMRYGGIRPSLTFTILTLDNIVLSIYNTGDIPDTPEPLWRQYGFSFSTVNDSRIKLKIANNAPGGGGNDLVLDDITFRPCGPSIETSIIGHSNTVSVCEGYTESFTFESTVLGGNNNSSFQWQISTDTGRSWIDIQAANGSSYSCVPGSQSGVYKYRMGISKDASVACRIFSKDLTITVNKNPIANAGFDQTIVRDHPATLDGTADGTNYTILWSPETFVSSPNSLNSEVNPPSTTVYTLHVITPSCGTAMDDVKIIVYPEIKIPNAFSPNNDGLNDFWNIRLLETFPRAEVKVFNRWGEVVFKSNSNLLIWDGTYKNQPQPGGVFTYIINLNNGAPVLKGTLVLLR